MRRSARGRGNDVASVSIGRRVHTAQREIRFLFESIGRFGEEHLSTGGSTKGAGVFDMVHARAEARVCALARLRSLARSLTTRALCHKFLHTAFMRPCLASAKRAWLALSSKASAFFHN